MSDEYWDKGFAEGKIQSFEEGAEYGFRRGYKSGFKDAIRALPLPEPPK